MQHFIAKQMLLTGESQAIPKESDIQEQGCRVYYHLLKSCFQVYILLFYKRYCAKGYCVFLELTIVVFIKMAGMRVSYFLLRYINDKSTGSFLIFFYTPGYLLNMFLKLTIYTCTHKHKYNSFHNLFSQGLLMSLGLLHAKANKITKHD